MSYLDFDFPHTRFFESDLRELIKQVFIMNDLVTNFVSINAIKYADPIQWNITKSYEKNTVVIDGNSCVAYISVRPVPAGVALTREQYWTKVFDLSVFITKGSANFANTYEAEPTTTATQNTLEDNWVVWDATLYQALTNIHPGDRYVPGGNIRRMTIEDFYNILKSIIDNEVHERKTGDDALEIALNEETELRVEGDSALHQEIVDEAAARESADTTLQNNINSEVSAREAADVVLQNNINEGDEALRNNLSAESLERARQDRLILERIDNNHIINVLDYGAQGDGETDDTLAIQNAINECPMHGTVYIPFFGTPYIITSLYIDKPIRLVSNYTGYEIDTGIIGMDTPVLQSTATGHTFAIYIRSYGVTVENLSIKTSAFGISCDTQLMPRFTVIRNVSIDCTAPSGGNIGLFANDCFLSTFERITVYHADRGFYIYKGTSSTYTNCWARDCTSGFDVAKLYYSSFINCCADGLHSYAFRFYQCLSTSMINCGHETNDGASYNFAAVVISECSAFRCEIEMTPDVQTTNGIYVAASNVLLTNCLCNATHPNGDMITGDNGALINVFSCSFPGNDKIRIGNNVYNYNQSFFASTQV